MKYFNSIFLALLLSLGTSRAVSGEFDGWCFPSNGCTGDEMIEDDSFATCEEDCKMTNPTTVKDMNAIIYDVICSGDSGEYSERMIFMIYKNIKDKDRAITLSNTGVTELARCQ